MDLALLKSLLGLYSLLWVLCGVGGMQISLREPPVRVQPIEGDTSDVDHDADVRITITDDDGTSPLPGDTVIDFFLVAEFDASLFFIRTYPEMLERVNLIPVTVTTVDEQVDYTIAGFRIGGGADIFLNSFRIVISLDTTGIDPPITVVGRPSFELWIHNTEAYPLGFLIMNPANVPPNSENDVYLYAISHYDADAPLAPPTLSKNGSGVLPQGKLLELPSAFDPETPVDQGRYWKLHGRSSGSRRSRDRYGEYVMNHGFTDSFIGVEPPRALLNPPSKYLDTGGKQTFTVYRSPGDPDILDEPLTFGVRQTALSGTNRWFKDGRFLGRGRAKMTIQRADQAGVYTLHRNTRKKRCWFVQIRVLLSMCTRSEFWSPLFFGAPFTCIPEEFSTGFGLGQNCVNGGVLSHLFQVCSCPPCFRGALCEHLAPSGDPFALMESGDFTCGQLPGGNTKCKGYKFCLGGRYGCSCGCGWHGLGCDQRCRKGTFGADCLQKCNCLGNTCDRFTGQCESTLCPEGYHGFNCQLPIEIHLGNPEEDII